VLAGIKRPHRLVSADEPTLRDSIWLTTQWEAARLLARDAGKKGVILAIDEVQKVSNWSETVKRLWDEDTGSGEELRVVLLGSTPLLLQDGLTESLTGRFEQLRLPHWSFSEMRSAFGFSVSEYLYFGGYPGAAPLIDEPGRWRRYILDALIETTISRDVLLMTRVDKPALLRRLFELGCRYSGQILSFNKMIGQLQDAGNTTTVAHYLDLLSSVGMLTGLPKYAGEVVRQRASSPKLQVLNTALLTAQSGLSPEEANSDREFRGRLTESAIGAHLANSSATGEFELFYWRDRNREVDYVLRAGRHLMAFEVKSSRASTTLPGMKVFSDLFHPLRVLLVGGEGVPIEEFLARPVSDWLGG
jgi:predicted AAA+ superfamily ATPase